jgi:RNA polymerase-binding transcription factor DksA
VKGPRPRGCSDAEPGAHTGRSALVSAPDHIDHEAMVKLIVTDRHLEVDSSRSRVEAEGDRLARLIAELEDEGLELESEADGLGELAPVSQHPADVGSETFERERDLSLLEEFRAELTEVEQAMRRIEDGTYGVCAGCRAAISSDRLAVVPATRYCKLCQDRYELRGLLATGSAFVAGGIVGDPAEFLPGDDDLEASASELANGPEEDAVATYGDAELTGTEWGG